MNMNLMGMHLGRRNRWQDLSRGARKAITIIGSAQVGLLASALVDLVRRPTAQVRGGRKWIWLPVVLVNGIGPLVYFAFGRRTSNAPADAEDREGKRKKKGKNKKDAAARTDAWEM